MLKLAVTYTILALIATAANIGSQALSVRIYSGTYAIACAMIVGTGVGLIIKYLLDKKYIFAFTADNAAHDTRTFLLYAAMGLITTAIFWGLEILFHFLFHTEAMRYIGGILGLAIGYISKYQLDKHFVFKKGSAL